MYWGDGPVSKIVATQAGEPVFDPCITEQLSVDWRYDGSALKSPHCS